MVGGIVILFPSGEFDIVKKKKKKKIPISNRQKRWCNEEIPQQQCEGWRNLTILTKN